MRQLHEGEGYEELRAATTEPDMLGELLHDAPYREAIGILQMISKSPEDYQYYEDRQKFLRDERGKLLAAEQEGEQRGILKGRQEGKLAGKIQMLQELLGDPVSTDEELLAKSLDARTIQLATLQERLRSRDT